MTFDEALQQHKDNLTKSLSEFGEGHRLNRMHKEIDSNAADYEYYFNAGQQHQQAKVEELQKRLDAQTKHVEMALLAVKDIYKSAIDEFHDWDVFKEKAPKLCEHLQNLSVAVGELEQALKGEG